MRALPSLLHWLAAAALLLGGLAAGRAAAQEAQAGEYRIKAAFLCKFGNYVEWPAAAFAADGSPFGIGVVGSAAVVEEVVAAARGQLIGGRPIAVYALAAGELPPGIHLVFVARAPAARVAAALAAAKDRPVLTVTESETDAAGGAIVNFVVVDDKVKFDIALAPAERSGLKLSARLLGVARRVVGRPPS